jgi:hypothetical protein
MITQSFFTAVLVLREARTESQARSFFDLCFGVWASRAQDVVS